MWPNNALYFNVAEYSLVPAEPLIVESVIGNSVSTEYSFGNYVHIIPPAEEVDGSIDRLISAGTIAGNGRTYYFDAILSLTDPILPSETYVVTFNYPVHVLLALSSSELLEPLLDPFWMAAGVEFRFADTDLGPPLTTYIGANIGASHFVSSVPEPTSIALLALGLLGIAGIRRNSRA